MPHRIRRILLLLTLLAAFALRVFRLDAQSIWWDEGISLHLATSSLAEIVANRVVNIHPPLYFWGLKGWVSLLGVSAFSARFLSVVASLLQVPLVYALARRWFRAPRTAGVAMLLTAVSPLSIIYGQEIRTYAILPLIFLGLLLLTQEVVQEREVKTAVFISLGFVTWLGLHLHYIVVFAIFYVNAWALLALAKRRAWPALRRWLVAQGAAAAASLPWLIAVLRNWPAVQAEASAGTYLTEAAPLDHLLSQVWVFHLTALPGSLSRTAVTWLAAGTAVLLLLLLLLRLARRQTRRRALALFSHWFLPLSLAVVVWSLRSFSHPRYISMYALTLIPLVAFLLAPPRAPRNPLGTGLALLLGGCLLALSAWAGNAYFLDPVLAQNDDMRGVARYLEANAGAGDLVLIPDTDWSLPFEYAGEALVQMPGLTDPAQMWRDLAAWTDTRRRVYTVSYPRQIGPDWQGAVPFALEKAGSLTGRREFDGILLRTYALAQPAGAPDMAATDGRFGPLRLSGSWLQPFVPAHNGVTVALRWQLEQPVSDWYQAKVTLLDVDGWPLASDAHTLVDPRGRPTAEWSPGEPVTTFAFIPIPPGTPPLTYRVALETGVATPEGLQAVDLLDAQGMPQGRRLPLGTTQVTPAAGPLLYESEVSIPPLPQPLRLAGGLQLEGALVDRTRAGPGQPLFVQLQWRLTEALQAPVPVPQLLLLQDGRSLQAETAAPVWERYPASRWRVGESVVEHRTLTVPPQAAGELALVLAVGAEQVPLARVTIAETAHLFTPPAIAHPLQVNFGGVARLLGYDLPQTAVSAAGPVALTLYWESLTTGAETSYTVFAHLLDENGRLIGQHDAPPVNGRRPTTGWVSGEIILDEHPMTFREPFQGTALIEVGLYDPASGTRLLTDQGQDYIVLPVRLTVE